MGEYKVEWLIQQHREQWSWIADTILERRCRQSLYSLRNTWCRAHNLSPRYENFACELHYRIQMDKRIERIISCEEGCLFSWTEDPSIQSCCLLQNDSLYWRCQYAETYKEQAKLARKIANMPVKKEVVELAKSLGM